MRCHRLSLGVGVRRSSGCTQEMGCRGQGEGGRGGVPRAGGRWQGPALGSHRRSLNRVVV